jgi:hypothetical protein
MFKQIAILSLLAVAFCMSAGALSDRSSFAELLLDDPIAYIGHGAMFDRSDNRIEPTREFIADAQRFYMEFLSERLLDQQRQSFKSKRERLFAGPELDEQSRLIANSALIDWQIQNVDAARVEDLHRLAGKNSFLKWLLQPHVAADQLTKERQTFLMPDLLQNRLTEAGLSVAAARSTSRSRDGYIEECRNAGVPIPPDWGSPKWKSKGFLTTNFVGGPAEVFIALSSSPTGVTIALPRYAGDIIDQLGIISLGQASSRACFWDNHKDIPKGSPLSLREFAGGAELADGFGGRCTACHAGENPFVIHPNTNLGLPNLGGVPLFSNNWYQPLVHPGWPQNPGPLVGTTGACSACHTAGGEGGRFPDMSPTIAEYCGTVLGNAIKLTMPPQNPGDENFAEHANALEMACAGAGIAEVMEPILLPLR